MLFNSISYIVFFLCVCLFFFSLKHKYRWVLLLAASYFFYGYWKFEYLILIVFSTIIDYLLALQIERSKSNNNKKVFLYISIIVNLTVLIFFKYANFIGSSIAYILQEEELTNNLIHDFLLPVGISFYTFQSMSYTIDVYKKSRKAERHLGIFALYVTFFPQLVAGPIERSTTLLPQFYERKEIDSLRIINGLEQVLRGFFKKLVVADRLAIYVDTIYNNYEMHSGSSLLLATIFFAFQIYCDFSGYSDIAIGSARILGYDLMENFRRPYFSKSIKSFWSRWHISLSTWFRDYLYIPLGGNRVVKWRVYYNIFIVFLVSGLWHGANWTFVVWGALHGLFLVIESLFKVPKIEFKSGVFTGFFVFKTFILVCLAWIFFRSENINQAIAIVNSIPSLGSVYFGGQSNFIYSAFGLLILLIVELRQEYFKINWLKSRSWRLLKYQLIFILILLFGVFNKGQFIYFQF